MTRAELGPMGRRWVDAVSACASRGGCSDANVTEMCDAWEELSSDVCAVERRAAILVAQQNGSLGYAREARSIKGGGR